MENKDYKRAYNTSYIIIMPTLIVLLVLLALVIIALDVWPVTIICGAYELFTVGILIYGILTSPYAYDFHVEEVVIRYFFGYHVIVRWDNVYSIAEKPRKYSGSFRTKANTTTTYFKTVNPPEGKLCRFTTTDIAPVPKIITLIREFQPDNFI